MYFYHWLRHCHEKQCVFGAAVYSWLYIKMDGTHLKSMKKLCTDLLYPFDRMTWFHLKVCCINAGVPRLLHLKSACSCVESGVPNEETRQRSFFIACLIQAQVIPLMNWMTEKEQFMKLFHYIRVTFPKYDLGLLRYFLCPDLLASCQSSLDGHTMLCMESILTKSKLHLLKWVLNCQNLSEISLHPSGGSTVLWGSLS